VAKFWSPYRVEVREHGEVPSKGHVREKLRITKVLGVSGSRATPDNNKKKKDGLWKETQTPPTQIEGKSSVALPGRQEDRAIWEEKDSVYSRGNGCMSFTEAISASKYLRGLKGNGIY